MKTIEIVMDSAISFLLKYCGNLVEFCFPIQKKRTTFHSSFKIYGEFYIFYILKRTMSGNLFAIPRIRPSSVRKETDAIKYVIELNQLIYALFYVKFSIIYNQSFPYVFFCIQIKMQVPNQ